MAFQHDSMLTSKTCGGPVVDLAQGKLLESISQEPDVFLALALPVNEIRDVIEDLKDWRQGTGESQSS